MQKKILALAVLAAFAAPAFADSANVTVYGKVDVSYDSIKTGTSTAGVTGVTSNRVESNVSIIGFKGAEDLGDGLAAVWQVESKINVGDAAANGGTTSGYLGTRNTFAGLKSDSFGTVLGGRHDTPYKLATRRLDQFGDGIADNRSIMGGGVTGTTDAAQFDGRQDQVIAYITPNLGGFTVAVAHVNLNPTTAVPTATPSNANSVAAWYDANGLFGSLAYEEHNDLAAGGFGEKATKLGFGYTQEGSFTVGAVFEKTSDSLAAAGANKYGHNAIYLSGKVNVGANGAVKLALTKAGSTATANTGAKQYTLGYDYAIGKRTTVYALYTKLSNDSAGAYTLSGEPTIGNSSTLAGAGASPSAVAVGMKVVF